MRRRLMKTWMACAAGAAATLWHVSASAYNGNTHQAIVEHAWEIMLASQDPALTTGRGLFQNQDVPPKSLRVAPEGISQADWDVFLEDLRRAILALNRMAAGIPATTSPACQDLRPLAPLGQTVTRIDTGYRGSPVLFKGDGNGGDTCSTAPRRGGPLAEGIFAAIGMGPEPEGDGQLPGLGGEFGNTLAQGLILGWHAKAGDDCMEDAVFGINAAQIVANFPIPAFGGLSLTQVANVLLIAVSAPVLCLVSLFTGENCLDQAREFARVANPVTALAGLVPAFETDTTDSMFTGIPHYINAIGDPGLPNNAYDDRRGMYYERSGPGFLIGAVDFGIMVATEKTGAVVDTKNLDDEEMWALMIDRYDLGTGVGDGHPEERFKRSNWEWNRDTIGHTQMTPVDNFAYFGWNNFRNSPQKDVSHLRWPLHAIGDATVPMHVTTTSGWGHRPYEDAVSNMQAAIRFEGDELKQLEQARLVLEQAFSVRGSILQWRAARGSPNDVPVRDLITGLARSTERAVEALGRIGNEDWAYCDTCSIQYLFDKTAATNVYMDSDRRDKMRVLYEHSVAHTLAFLVSAAEQPITQPICAETGQTCSADGNPPCCVGECDGGVCQAPPAPTGAHSCDANRPCPRDDPNNPTLCINGYCQGGSDCVRNDQCGAGRCDNGFCDDACTTDTQCASGVCTNNRCCLADNSACSANGDCCSGTCRNGTCQSCTIAAGACAADADCCSGLCSSATCARDGTPGTLCATDSECVRGRCVNGRCDPTCASSADCPSGGCVDNECCVAQNSACHFSVDCCAAPTVLCSAGFCRPLQGSGGPCVASDQCLHGSCVNGVCDDTCTTNNDCDVGICQERQQQRVCCAVTGSPCREDDDCCTRLCTNNVCDPPPF
jgi:hypothetical protein